MKIAIRQIDKTAFDWSFSGERWSSLLRHIAGRILRQEAAGIAQGNKYQNEPRGLPAFVTEEACMAPKQT
jgi:hypothetical protein